MVRKGSRVQLSSTAPSDFMDYFIPLTFTIGLLASILSGIGGGGGGFIMMPYFLFIGLTPAQALATMKLSGIGTTVGSVSAFRGKGLVHKKLVIPFMILAALFSIIAAWIIPQIDPSIFQKIIAIILLTLWPTLFIKKAAFQPGERSRFFIIAGFGLYTVVSFLSTLVGTGMGSLLVLILMFLFGLGALEANATKRISQSVQSIILFVLLAIQGLVHWPYGLASLIGGAIGSHIGTHIAIKRGARFVKIALAAVMIVSGGALLL